jgi:hypothetical protein
MTTVNGEEPASKEELIQSVADQLGWLKATTRLHLERIRDDFKGIFGDRIDRRTGLSRFSEYDQSPTETLTQQRERFREIERVCKAAAAVSHAPQEVDWLPKKLSLRDPRSGVERQFEVPLTPIEYSAISWAYSEAGKQAAEKLEQAGVRSESTIAEEKAIARYVLPLMHGPYITEETSKPYRTTTDYVAANWAKLAPEFRKAHNRLLEARGESLIPEPLTDEYLPPAPGRPPRFPLGKYLTVTALVYEYVTDEHREADSFEFACREVRKEFEP